jgi:hypothetical protein
VRLLLEAGADTAIIDSKGQAAVDLAVDCGMDEEVVTVCATVQHPQLLLA